MENIQVLTRSLVVLLLFMLASGALRVRSDEIQWRDKTGIRSIIPGAPRGIKSFVGWNNYWKLQRCPPGMKRDRLGMCRSVWE
jgi:hypothetical protein